VIPLSQIPPWSEFHSRVRPPPAAPAKFPVDPAINSLVSFLPRGDSTTLAVDAIVNAANSALAAGGGICGAIFSAAGERLHGACAALGGCETGSAALTPGFDLPAKFVIHAVGPVGERPAELRGAYDAALALVDGARIRSVALCCLSTGIFGYPSRPAAHIALRAVREFLEAPANRARVDRVVFVAFLQKDVDIYERLLFEYFPVAGAPAGAEEGGGPAPAALAIEEETAFERRRRARFAKWRRRALRLRAGDPA
jgi:O-acetyl-ADP-ribose deacetylase (regulator of RNase III)